MDGIPSYKVHYGDTNLFYFRNPKAPLICTTAF
jgi:hypothetical protein